MSGKQWTAYAVGIVVGVVVGIATAGIGLAAYAGTVGVLAFGVTSSLMLGKPAGTGVGGAAAEKLQIADATEAMPVAVIFGMCRIAGNYMRYDRDSFRSVAVEADSGGGKGGGSSSQVVGFQYYLSYLYGMCMGQLDGIMNVWDGSEMKKVATGDRPFTTDTLTVNLSGSDWGGNCTFYRGSPGQAAAHIGSDSATWYTYPHTAYIHFENYLIGTQSAPRTILVEAYRWPVCLDAAGDVVPSILVHGSLTSAGPCWYDANPAAIIYEVLTNAVWGRGLSPDKIDVASFAAASEFFATNDIGISISLTDQGKLSDVIDYVRRHVNTCVAWDGSVLKLFVLMNPTDGDEPLTITRDQVTKPSVQRPAWPETSNELRLEFVNRTNSWQTEIAQVQDDAAIGAIGGIVNSNMVSLPGFTNRTTAEAQAQRILQEQAYPAATITFYMNMAARRLIPGRRVRFVWDELTAQALNLFYRVVEVTDNEQSADGVKVILAEDLYATPYLGGPQAFEAAVPGFSGTTFNSNDDLTLGGDSNAPYDPGDLAPLFAFELTIGKTLGTKQFAVLCQRGGLANIYALHKWALHGGSLFTSFAQTQGWCITGKLLSAVPTTACDIQRGTGGMTFTFDLTDPGDEADLLSSANKVGVAGDDLETLLSGMTDLLVIGGEVFFVGLVTETSPGVYEASNFIRAQWGTAQAAHAINDNVFFISKFVASQFLVSQGDIPTGTAIDLQTNVASPGSGVIATEFAWVGPNAGAFLGTGALAYCPGYLSHTIIGTTFAVNLRPRWHGIGAESTGTIQGDLNNFAAAIPDGYALYVQPFNGVTSLAAAAVVISSYTSDADPSGNGGVWSFSFTAPGGTNKLRVWAGYKGGLSQQYIDLT